MKNIAMVAFASSLWLVGTPGASAASANLEYIQDYEATYLATCTKAHSATECQRAMELLEKRLGFD